MIPCLTSWIKSLSAQTGAFFSPIVKYLKYLSFCCPETRQFARLLRQRLPSAAFLAALFPAFNLAKRMIK
jgi:hypothetical protein